MLHRSFSIAEKSKTKARFVSVSRISLSTLIGLCTMRRSIPHPTCISRTCQDFQWLSLARGLFQPERTPFEDKKRSLEDASTQQRTLSRSSRANQASPTRERRLETDGKQDPNDHELLHPFFAAIQRQTDQKLWRAYQDCGGSNRRNNRHWGSGAGRHKQRRGRHWRRRHDEWVRRFDGQEKAFGTQTQAKPRPLCMESSRTTKITSPTSSCPRPSQP